MEGKNHASVEAEEGSGCESWRRIATGLEILHLGDCFRLLAVGSGRADRLSCAGGEVLVLPVNFLVDGQDVVFRTGSGPSCRASKSVATSGSRSTRSTPAAKSGWSVLVRGLAEVEPDEEGARLDRIGLESWGGAAENREWVRIRPTSITGRRIASPDDED